MTPTTVLPPGDTPRSSRLYTSNDDFESQFRNRQFGGFRARSRRVLLSILCVAAVACGTQTPDAGDKSRLQATSRSEPRSYNRLITLQAADELLRLLTHDTLVRLNRSTGALEPRLAERWTSSPDHLRWTITLRRDAAFSDGTPLSSADVVFTFRAVHDPKVESAMATALSIDGVPIRAEAVDASTVTVTFPAAHGRGIELLSGLPILPRHRLEPALDAGAFRDAWSLATPLGELAGLGPFRLVEHVAGERLRFERNPHFWKVDDAGRRLPYLDEIELAIVAEVNAEVLRLESGQSDLTTDAIRPEDIAALETRAAAGTVTLIDAGVSASPDGLWFNLTPGTPTARTKPWLLQTEFRQAVSLAVDRAAFIDRVFLGEAVPILGPVTPGHGAWHAADVAPEFDRSRARTLLASIGLSDRDNDGVLDDRAGRPVRFTVLTSKGSPTRERSVSVLREQLLTVGIGLDTDLLDTGAMFDRFDKRTFDALYFYLSSDTLDPTGSIDFWRSAGPYHVWNPAQTTAGTPWEARIDDLMARVATAPDHADRVRLFAEVQRLFGEHLPAIYFAAGKVRLATSGRVRGVTASVLNPPILWNAEQLMVAPAPTSTRR